MIFDNSTEWLTTKQVAEYCGICDAAVRKRLSTTGGVIFKRCGRRFYINRASLLSSDWNLRR